MLAMLSTQDGAQAGAELPTLATHTSPDAKTDHATAIPFKHSPLHDLESVVWVVIWLFVCSEFVKPESYVKGSKSNAKLDEDWTRALEYHAQFAKKLFRKERFRQNAMITSNALLSGFHMLLPQLLEPAKDLDAVRTALVKRFVAVHKQRKQTGEQVPFQDMISSGIHGAFVEFLFRTTVYLASPGRNLKIDASAWGQQRKKLRDAVSEDVPEAPVTGTRRTLDKIQEGKVLSNKRAKLHRAQSASSARPTILSGPATCTRSRMRNLK